MAITDEGKRIIFAAMVAREPFKVLALSGHVQGQEKLPDGLLTGEDFAAFRRDAPAYAVYSYNTPIAWPAVRDGKRVWYVVRRRFSLSTERHKRIVELGIIYDGSSKV